MFDPKAFFIDLLKETPDAIVWKKMSKSYTGSEMIQEIENDTYDSKVYRTEVLRVSRDLIARKSK